ncbi:MAG: cell division protein SepF [Acidimicrobiia bacterium]|jgi:cell division inhibitor SepF
MASLWQKTLFYLGLVDDEQIEAAEETPQDLQTQVRTVEPPRRARGRAVQPPASRPAPTPSEEEPRSLRPPSVVAGRRVEPPTATRRKVSDNMDHAEAGVLIRPGGSPHPAGDDETPIIPARTLSDAQTLADHIRDGQAVVLDLRDTESAMVRRLVDFSSGLTYALDGRMVKIAKGVILVTPSGVVLSVSEQRRLADLGLYTAAIGS